MISFLAQHAGMIGLLFFFGFFTVMLIWVFRPGAKKVFQDFGDIPLKEKDNE